MPGPLAGIRVAEFGTGSALAYCGKLFADFGADVVKVEPPGGDPGRSVAAAGRPRRRRRRKARVFAWLQHQQAERHRRRRTTSPGCARSPAPATCCSTPAGRRGRRRAQRAMRRCATAFPQLNIVSISWFGESGPYRDFVGADAVVRALAGVLRDVGPAEAPVFLAEHQAGFPAALAGFTAALRRPDRRPAAGPAVRDQHPGRQCPDRRLPVTRCRRGAGGERSLGPQPLLPGVPGRRLSVPRGLARRHRLLARPVARLLRTCWDLDDIAELPEYQTLPDRFVLADELEALFKPQLAGAHGRGMVRGDAAPARCRSWSCPTWPSCWPSRCTAAAARSARCRSARRASRPRCCRSG